MRDHTIATNAGVVIAEVRHIDISDEAAEVDHYDAFRRAHGLWVDDDGNFFAGVFADSPHAVTMTPASFVGWIAGTEYANDEDFWMTVALSDVESIAFMERDGFVLYGEPDGDAAYTAYERRIAYYPVTRADTWKSTVSHSARGLVEAWLQRGTTGPGNSVDQSSSAWTRSCIRRSSGTHGTTSAPFRRASVTSFASWRPPSDI